MPEIPMRGSVPRRTPRPRRGDPLRVVYLATPISIGCGDVDINENESFFRYLFPCKGAITRSFIYIKAIEDGNEGLIALYVNDLFVISVPVVAGENLGLISENWAITDPFDRIELRSIEPITAPPEGREPTLIDVWVGCVFTPDVAPIVVPELPEEP
jgi:hypothetical protein